MGQKTHPLGFRLGITKEHKSKWYSKLNKYSIMAQEDHIIRSYFSDISRTYGISNVVINRNGLNNHIEINIETARPGALVGDSGTVIRSLIKNIKKRLSPEYEISINLVEIKNPNLDAVLLADLIATQLEQRVAFRRAMRDILQRIQDENVNGIKIQISGRLNGAEMARTEWTRDGRVPLQTLRADIDYAQREANTIYGVLGIKIWLFISEKSNNKFS